MVLCRKLLLLIFTCAAATATSDSRSPPLERTNVSSVYDILPKFGLPLGLLPNNVISFSLAQDGAFEVNLADACYVKFEYLVYYAPKITGVIRYGLIENLKGIQVERFLLWLDVDAIKVDLPPSNFIYFDVGFITKKLGVDQFKRIHSCNKRGIPEGMMHRAERLDQLFEDNDELRSE
ncbi:hypothetical protein HPP92_015372 [Vanilla planifolia]|uniref:Uncharacterized protein n=1 Tax=Vanilla planifolia TaxID=51239 RepID=A0A835QLR3_VANPL|nr:hypothetical protein HPP92_015938 [Vanilla planifolia]KAG0475686.1 hypothetical protein HPP92_015372 [Vanilla planifolia]